MMKPPDDPLTCNVDLIKDIKVENTIVGTEIVFNRDSSDEY